MGASFWLEQASGGPVRSPLEGRRDAAVCVIGGGFTGLWTALALRRADPTQDVVVLEAESCGFGASGRNGGWVSGELSGRRAAWAERGGRAGAVAQERAIQATVDAIGAVVAEERIACGWHKGGSLHVARSALELARVAADVADDRAWGLGEDDSVLLDADAAAGRIGIDGVRGARFTPHCARVQPAALLHGLAGVVERAGAVIHEGSPAVDVAPGHVRTPAGSVRARTVVLAAEGHTGRLPGGPRLLPVGSSMIVTEPLDAATWAAVGWSEAETLLDGRRLYAYAQRTADDRIAIGGRGVPYRFGSRVPDPGPPPRRTVAELRDRLAELLPRTADAPIAGAWQGVLGVTRTWCPAVGLDRRRGLAWAGGYAGEGVAAAHLAGQTLADLVAGADTERTRLPWVGPLPRRWEPEPLRWLGVRGAHALLEAADRRERASGRPSRLGTVSDRISGR